MGSLTPSQSLVKGDTLSLPEPFASIPREQFLFGPSPIQTLPRISKALGGKVAIFAKREDCNSGLAYGGNKTRKLEYFVPAALAEGCDTLISIGGVQSNHTRQVSAVAAKVGLKAAVVQERWVDWEDPVYDKAGNIQLSRLMNADTRLDPSPFGINHKPTLKKLQEELIAAGRKPYYIPAGASDHPLGGLGFARWAFEVEQQERESGIFFDVIIVCAVTGSTMAGMVAGFRLLEKMGSRPRKVIGIDASAKVEQTAAQVLRIAKATGVKIGLEEGDITEHDIILDSRYHAGVYGIPDQQTKDAIKFGAETEAFITDPVYEGKSLAGMMDMLQCIASRGFSHGFHRGPSNRITSSTQWASGGLRSVPSARAGGAECVYSGPEPRPRSSRPPRRVPNAASIPSSESLEDDGEESPQSAEWPNWPAQSNPGHGRGYLGATSFGAVFEEARNSLSLLSSPDVDQARVESERDESHVSFREITPPLREMCLCVLRCLADHLGEPDESSNAPPCDHSGWADIAVDRIIKSLQAIFSQAGNQKDEGLKSIAVRISRNTTRPLRDDVPTPEDWLSQFCGENLRWESIGLLWAHIERITDILHSIHCRRLDWLASRYPPNTARTCLDYCITLSRSFSEQNILLLDLARRKATLESTVYGEARVPSYVSFGMAVAMMTFLGLHVTQQDPSYTPTLCSENRRRLFAQIFVSDKLVVSFTGRPPLVSRRFCSTPLPLDFRDEELASDPLTLKSAFESLDANGWNTAGGLYPTTVIRARVLIAYIRDELVEIALSHNVDVSLDQLRFIKARQLDTYAQFPIGVVYRPEELTDPNYDLRNVYVKILVHLEHLKNIFFAERLLVLHGDVDEGDIIVTSFTILSRVLIFWTHREKFSHPSIRRNFEWLVLVYGAPAAGILCLELLRPSFPRFHPKEASVSRSSIIQQLSLLVGLLDWVNPSAPNRDLCVDSKKIIQRVLDHHLNSGMDVTSAPMDWGLVSIPDFNFELMDTFGWARLNTQ
ncbi:1-aminocyclopropane-1-carboxylate deaminase [Seiridium cupressi]